MEVDDGEDPGDVFAIPDILGQSKFREDIYEPPAFLFATCTIDDIEKRPLECVAHHNLPDDFFANPNFSFGPPSEPPTASNSSESVKAEDDVPERGGEQFDIWIPLESDPPRPVKFLTWDSFEDDLVDERYSAFVTEARPDVLDAALSDVGDILGAVNSNYVVVQLRIYASSLLALGLGRSSVLFVWSEEKKSFVQALSHMRISGCTGQTILGISTTFMSCGNTIKALQEYADETYASHKSPGRIALADAVCTLLSIIQCRLNIPTSSLASLLQLQAIFRPAASLLVSFYEIVKSVGLAKSDEAILTRLFEEVQQLEHRTDLMKDILLEVLARVSRPFLDFAGEWLGLQAEAGIPLDKKSTGRSFVQIVDRLWTDEQGLEIQEPGFALNTECLPSFIPLEEANTMFETGKSLRFLKTHHPDHALSRADVVMSVIPPILDWDFTWQGIEHIEQKALNYERDLTAALKEFSIKPDKVGSVDKPRTTIGNTFELDIFSKSKEEVDTIFKTSVATLSQPLPDIVAVDRLSKLLTQALSETEEEPNFDGVTFAPPISLTPFLSFGPIIAAQARIVNGATMRLFFKAHNLREHLSIQRRFQLMGDGMFSSRLSHALFDPELETAERQAGVARTGGIMGLRLGGRDTWPPASSELRLALMGVLTESYSSSLTDSKENAGGYLAHKEELPGDLSFGVREMSSDEIEACVDPNSVEALDFLRISYKPPVPLEAVITPLALYKYDQVFKLLLRVTRMLYVVAQLLRDATDRSSSWKGIDTTAQRFRIEAHHFVTCVSAYFFDTGIDATWRIFDKKLDQIEDIINEDKDIVSLSQDEGIDKLREYHERVLDRVMFALLLRKRQQAVMKLLEEIFALILGFAKYSRARSLEPTREVGQKHEVREMYMRFHKKVEVFITVCRGLSEGKGYGEKRAKEQKRGAGGLFNNEGLAEENTVVQLLTRLEMSNYYSLPVDM